MQRSLAGIDDDVVLVINHAFELPRAHVKHEPEPRRHALIEPNVRNGHRQFDMAHTFTANPGECDLDTATVANHAFVLNPLIFSARAFPVARRTKNSLAEKSALLRFKGAIINCLWIFDFSLAPRSHRVARRDANRDLIKTHGTLFAH